MDAFVLNGRAYTPQQLRAGSGAHAASAYERRVLQFCQQWLLGQDTFTLQTSGSTGEPKAIQLTRAQMCTSAQWTGQAVGLKPGDHALVCLDVDYIAGMMMFVRGFELGLRLTVIDPVSRPLAAFAPETRLDFTAMVPLQVHATLQGEAHERYILNTMRAVLIGGAPVSLALEAQCQEVQAALYHTYGMTETVSHIALRRLNGPHRSARYVPFAGVRVGVDARGCLTITAAVTRGETYVTNDLVTLHPDGAFEWLGRVDNVINSGGVKVHIEKVERALEAWLLAYQGGVYAGRRFLVGARAHPQRGDSVVVLIEGAPCGQSATEAEEVALALRTQRPPTLTPYEIPRQVFFIPQLQETRTGKVDRHATLQQLTTSLADVS